MKAKIIILMFSVIFLTTSISQGLDELPRLDLKARPVVDLTVLNESRDSLKNAFDYFCNSQLPNGSWKYDPAITSLVLYSFMLDPSYNPDAKTDEVIKKGYAFLEKFVKPNGGIYNKEYRNYSTAVGLLAFTAAGKEEYRPIIENAKKFLIKFQLDEGEGITPDHPFYGGIGYGGDDRPDLSNTQLALEAIDAAEKFEADSDDKIKKPEDNDNEDKKTEKKEAHWQKAQVFLNRTQNLKSVNSMDYARDNGGFIYETGHYKPERSISYGSMTYAGLKSLLFAGINKNDIRVRKAYGWICANYSVEENPNFGKTSLYYYFMTATKCLTAFGNEVIVDSKGEKHYWREDFIKKIVSLQHEDGYWVNQDGRYKENIKDLATAYSVIAIKHALRKVYYSDDQPKKISSELKGKAPKKG